jgi:hypothetical protein
MKQSKIHPRLINQLLENPEFKIDRESLGYLVRDIINMNWWNTCGVHLGYSKNKRLMAEFSEDIKRIAVTLKEFYRESRYLKRSKAKLQIEVEKYISGKGATLEQLRLFSLPTRRNVSQYFVDAVTCEPTWAAKYVCQNGYLDFDGLCRLDDGEKIAHAVTSGICHDIGTTRFFVSGKNMVKYECFSQKNSQLTIIEWVAALKIKTIPERKWLLKEIGHVKTDPYKKYEAECIALGLADGVNERLYGFQTSASGASHASGASRASDASHASNASRASDASHASNASRASDAGTTQFTGTAWKNCTKAITKPAGLEYPLEFHANIFGVAGHWKINRQLIEKCTAWFDPFMGHGESPMLAKKLNKRYIGFDTNTAAFENYLNFLQSILDPSKKQIEMRNADSTVFDPALLNQFDLCYTSPPYFDFEEYGGNTSHIDGCKTYEDFHKKVTIPVFKNARRYLTDTGILAVQTEKDKNAAKKWVIAIESCGFSLLKRDTQGIKSEYSKMCKGDQTLLIFEKLDGVK